MKEFHSKYQNLIKFYHWTYFINKRIKLRETGAMIMIEGKEIHTWKLHNIKLFCANSRDYLFRFCHLHIFSPLVI